MSRKMGVILAILLALILAPAALALEARGGDAVVIEAGEVIADDLYISAETFTLNGAIEGDLIVAGGVVTINGVVEGDLLAAGQTVIINGTVADDARVAGMALELGPESEVGDDVVAAAYSLHGKEGSSVAGTLLFGGFQGLLAGDVAEDVLVGANRLRVNGRIAGDIQAEVAPPENTPVNPAQFMTDPDLPELPTVPAGFTFGETATVAGDVRYSSTEPLTLSEEQVEGAIRFEREAAAAEEATENPAAEAIRRAWRGFVAVLLLGLLLVWLRPRFVERGREILENRPWPSLGWGAGVYFGLPLVVVILFIAAVLLGILFGLVELGNLSGALIGVALVIGITVMAAFVLALLYLTKILVGYALGYWILSRTLPQWVARPFLPLTLGLIIIMIAITIPWLGALLNWIIALVGMGILWLMWRGSEPIAKELI